MTDSYTFTAPDGAQVTVHLNGAHITSWIADGQEQLFLSRSAIFSPGKAIRGGVPIIFPQFSDLGSLPKHGFARTINWEKVDSPDGVKFQLRASEATRAIWNYDFLAEMLINVDNHQLAMTLRITNHDQQPFTFTVALHTYLRVENIDQVGVVGLEGKRYWDNTANRHEAVQPEKVLKFMGELDRVYLNVPNPVTVQAGKREIEVSAENFPDVVVWNPGTKLGATIADLESDGYQRFVCIEAAVIGQPMALNPNEIWQGTQTLRV